MEVDCAFAPTTHTPENIAVPEQIAYQQPGSTATHYSRRRRRDGGGSPRHTSTNKLGASSVTKHLRHLVTDAPDAV